MLKFGAEISDQLYEFFKFCSINNTIFNKIYSQLEAQKDLVEGNSLAQMVELMPNVLNFENKVAQFKKELQKLKKTSE